MVNMFDRFASYYDTFMSKTGLSNIDAFVQHVPCAAGLRVADIGGGTGTLAKALVELKAEVTLIDPSVAMTDVAQKKHSGIRILNARVENLPITDGDFDMVCIRDLLHHLRDWEQALREAVRVLKQDGMILVHELEPESGQAHMIYEMESLFGETITAIPRKQLASSLQVNGVRGEIRELSKYEYLFIGKKTDSEGTNQVISER